MKQTAHCILSVLVLFFCLTVPITCQPTDLPKVGDIITRHPYIVSVRGRNQRIHLCSGVLLGQFSVLTSASCVDPRVGQPDTPVLWLNASRNDELDGVVIRATTETVFHPNYTGNAGDGYNMAMLRLNASSLPLRAMRILPENSSIETSGRTFLGIGYGRTSLAGTKTTALHIVQLNVIDSEQCMDANIGYIEDQMFCVDNPLACAGDEGGPVFFGRNQDAESLYGIISGTACSESADIAGVTSTATDETITWLRSTSGNWEPAFNLTAFLEGLETYEPMTSPDFLRMEAESPLTDPDADDLEFDLENDL